jgi:hypothetical protein
VIVLTGKVMKIRAVSALDFGYPTQITVDSFFNYLYYPTQSLAFTPTRTLSPETESRKIPVPFVRWGFSVLSLAMFPFGSRP